MERRQVKGMINDGPEYPGNREHRGMIHWGEKQTSSTGNHEFELLIRQLVGDAHQTGRKEELTSTEVSALEMGR